MKKVLLIEDEASLQQTLSGILREEGFEVVSALNGEDGIRMARDEQPDIILLDLILPKRSGFEVLEELKGDEGTKEIPVIVLTNLEVAGDIDRVLAAGATTYLVKANYGVEELITKVREVLKSSF